MKRRLRYAPPKHGTVAVAPKAWGEEFDVFVGGRKAEALFEEAGGYAVVEICGPLVQRVSGFGDSYEDIAVRVAAALQSGSESVCLRIDSPGGDWCGALELARELRAMAAKAGKKLVAFTDGMALSAGYAIACAASEIVATESASVGSIGVWAAQVDVTAQDAMMGVKVAIAASGAAKAERNPHAGITDASFTRLQAQVDEQAELFFELVSEARGMPLTRVRALEGAEVFGQRGIAAGLTDRIVNSWSELLTGKTDMPSKASKYDEAYGLLKQAAEGEDEEAAKKAKKALKAMEEGDEPPEEKEKKDAKAKAEKDGEKCKAEDEEKREKEAKAKVESEKEEKEAKAKASADPGAFDLARRVHALEADKAAKADAEQRAALLAKRPDFSPEIVATLAKASIEQLKEAVETWPKIGSRLGQQAAASQAGGTRGKTAGQSQEEPRPIESLSEEEYVFRRMGGASVSTGVRNNGRSLELGFMTPDEARAHLAKKAKEGAAA